MQTLCEEAESDTASSSNTIKTVPAKVQVLLFYVSTNHTQLTITCCNLLSPHLVYAGKIYATTASLLAKVTSNLLLGQDKKDKLHDAEAVLNL